MLDPKKIGKSAAEALASHDWGGIGLRRRDGRQKDEERRAERKRRSDKPVPPHGRPPSSFSPPLAIKEQ